jgi:hypothetical protein
MPLNQFFQLFRVAQLAARGVQALTERETERKRQALETAQIARQKEARASWPREWQESYEKAESQTIDSCRKQVLRFSPPTFEQLVCVNLPQLHDRIVQIAKKKGVELPTIPTLK